MRRMRMMVNISIHNNQGFKKRDVTAKTAVTNRYRQWPLPFLPLLTLRKKFTEKTPLRPLRNAVTTAKCRYARETEEQEKKDRHLKSHIKKKTTKIQEQGKRNLIFCTSQASQIFCTTSQIFFTQINYFSSLVV
jgi:hypothetical protein